MNAEVKTYMESHGFEFREDKYISWFTNGKFRVHEDQATFFYNAHIASARKVLEDLQAKGHGGGNWRRLIEVEISTLERKGDK